MSSGSFSPKVGLDSIGLTNLGNVHWTLTTPQLYEHIIARGEGHFANGGPLVVNTSPYTGPRLTGARHAARRQRQRSPAARGEKGVWKSYTLHRANHTRPLLSALSIAQCLTVAI